MTHPMFDSVAVLALICAVYPAPKWMLRLRRCADWPVVAAWSLALVYSIAVWVWILWIVGVV